MPENENVPLKGTLPIEVNKDVVRHLSLGLYRNYALAIKELISNSYDAGATEVKIKLDLKAKRIIIRDNGRGMNFEEFKDEYLHIGNFKAPTKTPDELGRMRIGTFGIGFLAPLPYCKTMRVYSKKKGNTKVIETTIKAEEFFQKGAWNIKDVKVPYEIKESDLPEKVGETIVYLDDIPPQIVKELGRKQKSSKAKIDQLSGFEKFKWTLCQYCPIQFPTERGDLRKFFDYPERKSMRIWLDAVELFRNVPKDAKILEKDTMEFGDIKVKYVIMTPYDPIKPEEARGLQIRLRDVAIGFPRDFDVTKLGRNLGKLNFIAGEVHIVHGLDNTLMVTRDSFNYTQEVAEIYEFFRKKLTEWNDKLYDDADKDKAIHEALPKDKAKDLEKELKNAGIIEFKKERFRLTKNIVTKKSGIISNPSQTLKQALSKKPEYRIVESKQEITKTDSPIKIDEKKKTITVFEKHPSFVEILEIDNQKYKVAYENWNFKNTPYTICKFSDDHSEIIFNSSHPLFKTKISHDIIKQLSAGILLIVQDRKDKEILLLKFNHLLGKVFNG